MNQTICLLFIIISPGEITKLFLRGFHSWSKIAITTSEKKSSNLVFETSQDHIQLHTKITSQNPITLWLCRSTDNLLKSKLPYCVDLWPQALFPIFSSAQCFSSKTNDQNMAQEWRGKKGLEEQQICQQP